MSAHENAARHDITLALLSSRPPPVSAGLHATDLALLLGVPKERQAGCPRGAYPCTPCVRQAPSRQDPRWLSREVAADQAKISQTSVPGRLGCRNTPRCVRRRLRDSELRDFYLLALLPVAPGQRRRSHCEPLHARGHSSERRRVEAQQGSTRHTIRTRARRAPPAAAAAAAAAAHQPAE